MCKLILKEKRKRKKQNKNKKQTKKQQQQKGLISLEIFHQSSCMQGKKNNLQFDFDLSPFRWYHWLSCSMGLRYWWQQARSHLNPWWVLWLNLIPLQDSLDRTPEVVLAPMTLWPTSWKTAVTDWCVQVSRNSTFQYLLSDCTLKEMFNEFITGLILYYMYISLPACKVVRQDIYSNYVGRNKMHEKFVQSSIFTMKNYNFSLHLCPTMHTICNVS